jgi:hypothetical protein
MVSTMGGKAYSLPEDPERPLIDKTSKQTSKVVTGEGDGNTQEQNGEAETEEEQAGGGGGLWVPGMEDDLDSLDLL